MTAKELAENLAREQPDGRFAFAPSRVAVWIGGVWVPIYAAKGGFWDKDREKLNLISMAKRNGEWTEVKPSPIPQK